MYELGGPYSVHSILPLPPIPIDYTDKIHLFYPNSSESLNSSLAPTLKPKILSKDHLSRGETWG